MEKIWLKSYPEGVPEQIDYPNATLYQLFEDIAKKWSNNTALIFMGKEISYAELKNQIDLFATALHELGIRKSDRVAIFMPNCPQVVISYFAVLRLGAIVVMCNPLYTEKELLYQLNDSGAETVISLDMKMTYPKIESIKDDTKIRRVIVSDLREYLPFPLSVLFPIARRKDLVKVKKDRGVYFFKELLNTFKGISIGITQTQVEMAKAAKQTAAIVKNGLVKSISGGIQNIVQSLAAGENVFANFGKFILQTIGDLAIQLGTFFIAQGIAVEAMNAISGTGAIVAGAALVALGSLLKAAAGSGGAGGGASAGGGGGGAATPTFPTDEGPSGEFLEEATAATPSTVVNFNIDGNVKGDEEFIRDTVASIGEEAGKQGLVFDNFATA